MASSSLSRRTDLHPFHITSPAPLGGDMDAAFTAGEIADWAQRFKVFDRFVLGTHSPSFFRIRTSLSQEEYLHGVHASVEAARTAFSGTIFYGIECDFKILKRGKAGFNPSAGFLEKFNPDIAIVGFHFHNSLTYSGLYDMDIKDVVSALENAIKSGIFAVISHPFDVMERLWEENPKYFEKVADLARENKVAFGINADKGFYEDSFKKLIGNGNLFSFGGDLHSFSHWLKRDWNGFKVSDEDTFLVKRVLGLANDAADKEKIYWREMDPLFRELKLRGVRHWGLRQRAIALYKSYLSHESFERGLKNLLKNFGTLESTVVERHIRELDSIYQRWGGDIDYKDRMMVEKYFLQVPLTAREVAVYDQWLERAVELGLKTDALTNTWETPKLKRFLARKLR